MTSSCSTSVRFEPLGRHSAREGVPMSGPAAIDGPVDDPPRACDEHEITVIRPLAGGVLGDVGYPQLVDVGLGEVVVD
jgi:hypothetical protein